jgi:hypothetical protein
MCTQNIPCLLDAEEVKAVLVGDEVDGQAQVPEAARPTDAVQVRLRRLFHEFLDVFCVSVWMGVCDSTHKH